MKFCTNCGKTIPDGSAFCANCGAPVKASADAAAPEKKPVTAAGFFSAAGDLGGSLTAPRAPAAPVVPAAPTMLSAPRAPAAPVVPAAPTMPSAPRAPAAPVVPAAPAMPSAPKAPAVPAAPAAPMPPHAEPKAPPAPTPPPAYTPPPVRTAPPSRGRRIPASKELSLLLRQGFLVMLGEKRNLIISLLFPLIATVVTVWIAGKDMFVTYESTKSACFILVCAAIWCGLFNSIQTIVKERENIKRDYVSGALRIECYMGSRAILQMALCLVQSIVLTMSLPAVEWVHGNEMPAEGILGGSALLEYGISLFFIMAASDAMGLMISCFVKKEELASRLAPYILIAQMLFSGVLFKLEGASNILSAVMISRWGMEAMGSISDLNDQPTRIYVELSGHNTGCACQQLTGGECPCIGSLEFAEFSDSFAHETGHLLLVFFVMLLFVLVPLVAGNVLLHQVKHDGRD